MRIPLFFGERDFFVAFFDYNRLAGETYKLMYLHSKEASKGMKSYGNKRKDKVEVHILMLQPIVLKGLSKITF
jgi:hypothetical protein